MAGEGSMLQAIKSLNNNLALRKNNRNGWKKLIGSKEEKWEDPKQASPEVLEEIRNRLQAENKAIRTKRIRLSAICIGLLIVLFLVFNQLYSII